MANVRLSSHARRHLRRLYRSDRRLFERVDRSLDRLVAQPSLGKPLVGPLEGHPSLRVGPVRIIYRVEAGDSTLLILDIAHRSGAYRDLP